MCRSRAAGQIMLLILVVVPLATLVRWQLCNRGWGPSFLPHPDSLEYAAGAQSIAHYDDYFLQVGPHRVPPRYPPGWPWLLSLAVRAGVPGESLWKVTAMAGALVSLTLAVGAWAATRWLLLVTQGSNAGGTPAWAPICAGLTAGLIWSFAPLPVFVGQTCNSDEPCLLLSLVCLALLMTGTRSSGSANGGRLWLLGGGLALGLVAAIRFVSAALLIVPIVVVLTMSRHRQGWHAVLRRGVWIAAGAICMVAFVAAASGVIPWHWSGYAFWSPRWYASLTSTFNLSYALHGNPAYYRGAPSAVTPHLIYGLHVLFGLTAGWAIGSIGRWWPVLGWAALGWGWVRMRRLGMRGTHGAIAIGGLAVWALAHLALFSFYLCHEPRFFLAPLAVCVVGFAVGCGVTTAARAARFRITAGLAACGVVVATIGLGQRIPTPPAGRQTPTEVRASFDRWRAAGDDGRRGKVVPFDLVQAQALGLYTRDALASVKDWGLLPRQRHVVLLLSNGELDDGEVSPR